jgi:heme exporter protein D
MSLHLDAGKYALYLWPAYGLSVVVIGGLVVESLTRAARWRRAAEAQERNNAPPPDSL